MRGVRPLGLVLVPIFFIHVGLEVDLRHLTRGGVALAACLVAAAVIGKLAAGAMASRDKLVVAVGMLPRGEVTLIFATAGLADSVINQNIYAALVAVVLITTLSASVALQTIAVP